MAEGQLNATQQLDAALQAINSGNAKVEWQLVGGGSEDPGSWQQVLVGNNGQVFQDVKAQDLGGGQVKLTTSAPAAYGDNSNIGITTSINPNTGTVTPITSQDQVAVGKTVSSGYGGGLLGGVIGGTLGAANDYIDGDFFKALPLFLAMAGGIPSLEGAGASDLTNLDALRADNIDVGGGWNPATGMGDAATAAAAAATGVTSSAYTPHLFTPSGLDVNAVTGGVTTTTAPTTTTTLTDTLKNLTPTQITTLAKAGINVAGILGAGAAVNGITNNLTNTGAGGGLTSLTPQDRSGVSSGTANYSPEYYQAIQAKYNQMMPQQPRDVTTDLKSWYETKYAPKVA